MGNCLTISADDGYGGHRNWDSHPAKSEWIEIHELGHGSFSKVVLAKHAFEKGRVAALKIVFVDDPELDVSTAKSLLQESMLLQELDHPNIVKCYNVIPSAQAVVFELEYLRGCTVLDGIYFLRNTYSERDAARIFTQVAQAVAYMHSKGIIHRDIKPENVVFAEKLSENQTVLSLGTTPVVKLLDLGLALRYDPPTIPFAFGCLGSAGFIAPEIIKGEKHTPSMDVYGMGVLLFVMLVGRKPWDIQQCEKLQYHDIPLRDAPGLKDPRWIDLSPDAKHLLMGMLTPDPQARFTAEQILQHEWVETEGGLTIRHLGRSIALGAATVAEMRRLRYISKGVSVIDNTENDDTSEILASPPSKQKYLAALDRSIRKEKSVHGNTNIAGIFARNLTAKSFGVAHDAGRSVHERVLEGSQHLRNKSAFFSGIEHNADDKQVSSFKILGRAVKHYLEETSVHRGSHFKPMSRSHSEKELQSSSIVSSHAQNGSKSSLHASTTDSITLENAFTSNDTSECERNRRRSSDENTVRRGSFQYDGSGSSAGRRVNIIQPVL